MGQFITLTAADGFELQAYEARPKGTPRGGLIVGQELFGVNAHIQAVAEGFAAEGYVAVAPCFYDRTDPGFAVGYSDAERDLARTKLPHLDLDAMMKDCRGAAARLAAAGKVGIVGYCSGGATAWYAAARLEGLACAVSYYGGRIPRLIEEQPLCPVMLHWAEADHTVSLDEVRRVEAAHPDIPSFVYPGAEHGFNCNLRPAAWNPEAAALARQRTLDFFAEHIG